MKKYLVWIGAAVLVLALASPSMAQFKSWGHLEIESYWRVNPSFDSSAANANTQGVGSRYRFNLGYGDPKTVMAVLGFEANAIAYGSGPEGNVRTVSSNDPATQTSAYPGEASRVSTAGHMNMGGWGTDTVSLQVRHAYLDFTIPNTPLTMQIGLQNRVIGGFLGRFFLNKDVPGYVLNFNSAPWTLSAMWFKGYKQSFYTDTDNDYYGLVYRLKQPTFNVEAWFFYNNDRRTQTEVWSYAQAGANPYTYALTLTTTARPYNYQPWWLGANVPITLGNFKIEATGIYQCGKYIADSSSASFVNADISAWLGDIMVTYRLGPGLSLLAEGFWATGVNGSRNANTSGGTYNQFTFFNMGSENRNVFGNGWSVFYFWNTQLSYYAGHQVDPGGHAFGRGNVEYNPLTWLNLNANYLYIYNTATNHYIAHITGAKNPYGTVVGQELNLIATIAIYKDFVYRIGYGYFFPGDVFDTPGGKSADQAWNLLTNLIYVF